MPSPCSGLACQGAWTVKSTSWATPASRMARRVAASMSGSSQPVLRPSACTFLSANHSKASKPLSQGEAERRQGSAHEMAV